MKIVFFVHCFFPTHFYGTETYTLALAKHYLSWGNNVTIVSGVFCGEDKKKDLVSRYFWEGIPVISIDKNFLPHLRIKETYYQSNMYSVLENILNELDPDIVHITHLINHTAILLEVTNRLNIPTYTTFTDFFGFCFNNKLQAANGKLCAGPSASRDNCIACYLKETVCNDYRSVLFKKITLPIFINIFSKILIYMKKVGLFKSNRFDQILEDLVQRPNILLNLYNKHYKAAISPTAFLKRVYEKNGIHVPITKLLFGVDVNRQPKPLRSNNHIPIIAYIGQIAPHKGIDILIKAFKKLPKNIAILKIYGYTNQSIKYMQKLKKLTEGINSIFFVGTFHNSLTANIFQNIDLLVIPSRWYENSPLVLLNSFATHTPVLISKVEGMTEFLNNGKNGYSFKCGNVGDLTEKLTYILQTPGLLSKLSLTTEYLRSTEVMAKETLDFYQLSNYFI